MDAAAAKAFVAAQKEMGKAFKGANNQHFRSKYANLGAVMDACYPALHAHGFAIAQPQGRDEHGDYVETVFIHESGEAFSSRVYLLLDKQNMQGKGSAITYARRYGLIALAGLEDTDDDGNAACKPAAPPEDHDKAEFAARCVEVIRQFRNMASLAELKGAWDSLNEHEREVAADKSVIKAKDERKTELMAAREAAE